MIIGVTKEIKPQEYRVGMVPRGIRSLIRAGNQVLIQ
jgi:alanine dehydrogenase